MCDPRQKLDPCSHSADIDNECNSMNKLDSYSNNYAQNAGDRQDLVLDWTDASPACDQTMNQLNKADSRRQCPDILRNITDYAPVTPPPHREGRAGGEGEGGPGECRCPDDKCRERLIPSAPDYKEMNNGGPWKSKDLGELVPEDTQQIKKRRRQRKLKKGMGWAFWVTCAPVALCFNCMRASPDDPSDPHDWNDDPLRPWRYWVDLPK